MSFKSFMKGAWSGIKNVVGKAVTIAKPIANILAGLGIPKVSQVAAGVSGAIDIGEGAYKSLDELFNSGGKPKPNNNEPKPNNNEPNPNNTEVINRKNKNREKEVYK